MLKSSSGSRVAVLAFATPVLLMALTSTGRAGMIFIANAGFEEPVFPDENTGTDNFIPGWTGTDSGAANNFGVYNPSPIFFPSEAPEGQNVAYIERGAIFQTLAAVLSIGEYSLTAMVGDSLIDPVSPFTVQLRAGGDVLAQASAPVPANGTFTLVTVNYTASAGNPLLGQALEVWLIDNDNSKITEPWFDDVRLNFSAVPEPSSFAMLGTCALGLLGYCGGVACLRLRRHVTPPSSLRSRSAPRCSA